MERLKKILASALLVCMLVSMLPVGALAEGEVCTHSYTRVQTLAPTCVAAGVMTYACSLCGDSYTETISATGVHNFGAATCTAPKTCAVCGATEGAALGHIAGEPVTEPASCAADGSTTVSCSACGAAISSTVIPATGIHTPGEAYVVTEATCTTEGSTAVACTVCGGVLSTGVIPALGHSYGEAVTKEATCTETGVKTFTCSGCGDSYTETIAALDHSYLNATCTAPKTCGKCGAIDGEPLGHDYADATCTVPKTCKVCTATEGEPLGHTAGETVTEPATCTVDGSITVKCSVCGEVASTEIISAPGHTAGEETVITEATCTAEGSKSVNCTVCGETYSETIPAIGHSYEEAVTKEATCTETGVKTFTCKSCGDSYTEDIEAMGHSGGEASCEALAVCENCFQPYGDYGHKGGSADCEEKAVCELCGQPYGEPLGHDYVDHKCTRCEKREPLMMAAPPKSTVKVDNITISGDASIEVGESIKLTATVGPADASNKNVVWSSSDTTVATVSDTGVVTGLKEGPVTITATAADRQGATDTATITVTPIKVKKINITGAELIKVKEETTLTATVLPSTAENRTIEWSSDKPSVATVNENGVVTGESTGTAIITATAKDGSGVSKGYMVYVQDTYNPYIYADRQTLYVGDTVSVELRHATFKNFTNVNWTFSGNDDEVEASGSGTKISVKAKKAGGVGISVSYTSNEGRGQIINGIRLTILPEDEKPDPVPVTSIEISGPVAVLADDTITLTTAVTPEYADDTSVTWTSSDPATATVDENGNVTGKKKGTVTITATANGGANVSATHSVTVEEIAVSIDGENSVYIGKSTTLIATVTPEGLTDRSVRWSSGDEDIATVDPVTGEVTGVAVGKVTITATSNADPGKSATHEIEVKAILVTEIQISGDSAVLVGSTIDLDAAITPDDATDKTVTWESSDPTIATVDANGVVTGLKADKVTITATSKADPAKSASKEITVKAPDLTVSGPGTVAVGKTITLTAKVGPDEVKDKTVTWTSSDETIATVDKDGKVTGKKVGDVKITATSNAYKNLAVEVPVKVTAAVYLYYGNGSHFNGIHAMPFVSSDLWAGGAGVNVMINGVPLVPGRDFSCYSSPHGMIGVTVNPGLLRLLPQNAWHSIEIVSANGVAAGSFSTGYFGYYNIYGVKTGDDSAPLLWAALCLLGISGAGIILVKSRKRKA